MTAVVGQKTKRSWRRCNPSRREVFVPARSRFGVWWGAGLVDNPQARKLGFAITSARAGSFRP